MSPPSLGRVLIVDDEPLVLLILRSFLEEFAKECVEASNASEALAAFKSGPFDLVLTDRVMAGMDGIALTAELKRHVPNQRVILVSGFEARGATWAFENDGPDAFLAKPFTRKSLLESIQAAWGRGTGE